MMLKQPGSRMCFVCGRENPIGLHAEFFIEGDTVCLDFVPQEHHQGYPGIMHGGLVSTLLDETVGRSAFLKNMWVVTAKMELRYRKPVPIGRPVRVVGWTTRTRGRILEAKGEVRLEDGSVAVDANAVYVEIPEDRRREVESLVY
jgi:acyl-coenzyme A thioesterase PaaI-like protein